MCSLDPELTSAFSVSSAALGDSIVPQVPMQIMQAIKQAENTPDGKASAKLEVFGISE